MDLRFYKPIGDIVSFQISPRQSPTKSKWLPFSKGGVDSSENSIRVPKEEEKLNKEKEV